MKTLTTTQAARLLGISRQTVHKMCGQGRIPEAVWIGGRWRIPREAVKRLLQQGEQRP